MASQSYSSITNALTQFASAHMSLKRFKCSFFEQFNNFSTTDNSFPILYAVPNQVGIEELINKMSFRIYCVDILQKDRSNESTILNDTLLVLRDLYNWITITDNGLMLSNVTPTAYPVNNFLVDFTVGWYMDFEIESPGESNDCSIPFSSNFILTGITCDETYIREFLTCDTLAACAATLDIVFLSVSANTGTFNTVYAGTYLNLPGIPFSGDTYWLSGTSGTSSIRQLNNSGLDATGNYAIATNNNTLASGESSFAQGSGTLASGQAAHAEGANTIASGDYSHAGGINSIASGEASFVHGSGSTAGGINTIVFGANITGTTDNTTYVDLLNIKTIGSTTSQTNLGIDSLGNVVSGLTTIDVFVTGGTYSNGTSTFTNNTGGTFNVGGFFTGATIDIYVTGGTYSTSTGITTLIRNDGGQINVSGFYTTSNDIYTTGLTYNNNLFTIKQTQGQPDLGVIINTMTGLTVSGDISIGGSATIQGNVYVVGTATTLNTETIQVEDNNIHMNFSGSHVTASGGGIFILSGVSNTEDSSFTIDLNGGWSATTSIASPTISATTYQNLPSWSLLGNSGTTAGTNFIGTTDAVDVYFKRNNVQAGMIGGSNTMLGANTSTAGSYNTTIGFYSGQGLVGGQFNAFLGASTNQGGNTSWCTLVGYGAGRNLGTKFGVVDIGNHAGAYTNESNTFFVNNIDQVNTVGDKAYSLLYGTFAGTAGTTAGNTLRINGTLSATTISATTYQGLPSTAIITGFTNSNNLFTIADSTGGTYSTLFNVATGLTINGSLSATSISAETISATTYYNLPLDIRVTGATYNNENQFTFTNNTGGTYSVLFNTMTGLTVNSAAIGGTITTSGNYTIHTFTSTGNTTFIPTSSLNIEYLVVGGGGGGGRQLVGQGNRAGTGGGGGGGMLTGSTSVVTSAYTITVGNGGNGGNGGYSSISGVTTAYGGGKGANYNGGVVLGSNGGSGGGGAGYVGAVNAGGSGIAGQGFSGGSGSVGGGAFPAGGGGGGAGASGVTASGNNGGNGGGGLSSSISGVAVFYAGGGGGASWQNTGSNGTGGVGGGGNSSSTTAGVSGTTNTGGGGGGGDDDVQPSIGGSGIVIIRYLTPPAIITNSISATSITADSISVNSTGSTKGIGYGAGAGFSGNQLTNKATTVISNALGGTILLNNASLASGTTVAFTVTNSSVLASDMIIVMHESGGTVGAYNINANTVAVGSFKINVTLMYGTALSEAIRIRYMILRSSGV